MDHDLILVGGGLANSLIALRLRQARPDLRLLLVERGASLGGNHTWSFHETDLDEAGAALVAPLVVHAWPVQTVCFPGLTRRLSTGYRSVTAQRLHEVVAPALGE